MAAEHRVGIVGDPDRAHPRLSNVEPVRQRWGISSTDGHDADSVPLRSAMFPVDHWQKPQVPSMNRRPDPEAAALGGGTSHPDCLTYGKHEAANFHERGHGRERYGRRLGRPRDDEHTNRYGEDEPHHARANHA